MALAIRSLGDGTTPGRPDPGAVLKITERVMREGDVRSGGVGADLGPEDALALLRAWLDAMDLDVDERNLLTLLQDGELSHPDLYRRARRIHERKLAGVVDDVVRMADPAVDEPLDLHGAALGLFDACIPAIPYAAASAFLGREKLKLTRSDGDRPRVALVADGLGGMHGVTHTIQQIRERGVPGFDVEVIGTDADVDRRLSAVAEVDIPFYPGLKVGVPSLPAIVDALAEGRYDVIHLCSPGPAGIGAWLLARVLELPVLGSYHTELAAYAGLRTGMAHLEALAAMALGTFYGACDIVLSPSPASDDRLRALGIDADRIGRWDRGVDLARFDPALRTPDLLPEDSINVLYAGRLTKEKGVELLADAFLAARWRDPRLHLVLAGGGPEEQALRERLGDHATFLGWLGGTELARAYASADAFLFASQTDTFGQVLLEAQASGLPVVAVKAGRAGLADRTRTDRAARRSRGRRARRQAHLTRVLAAAAPSGSGALPSPRSTAARGRRHSSASRRATAGRCTSGASAAPVTSRSIRAWRSPTRWSRSRASARACCRPPGRSQRRCCRSSISRSCSTSSRNSCGPAISRVLFVTGRRKRAIEDHFDADPELETGPLIDPRTGLRILYTRQAHPAGLGDALRYGEGLAAGGGGVVVALGDAIVESPPSVRRAIVPRLIDAFEHSGAAAVVAVAPVTDALVSRYGIVVPATDTAGTDPFEVRDVLEKPTAETTGSRFAVMSRYVVGAPIFAALRDTAPDASGEVQVADALRIALERGERVLGVPLAPGERRHDIGSIEGYCTAFIEYALRDPRFGDALRAHAAGLLHDRA